jgi:hypothetical protein
MCFRWKVVEDEVMSSRKSHVAWEVAGRRRGKTRGVSRCVIARKHPSSRDNHLPPPTYLIPTLDFLCDTERITAATGTNCDRHDERCVRKVGGGWHVGTVEMRAVCFWLMVGCDREADGPTV